MFWEESKGREHSVRKTLTGKWGVLPADSLTVPSSSLIKALYTLKPLKIEISDERPPPSSDSFHQLLSLKLICDPVIGWVSMHIPALQMKSNQSKM